MAGEKKGERGRVMYGEEEEKENRVKGGGVVCEDREGERN